MESRGLRVLGTALPAALLACISAGLPRPVAPELYALDAPAPATAAAPGGERTPIAVAAPRAAPGSEGRGIVYLRREHEIRHYARSAWVEPPARMLAPLLARALEAHGAFLVVTEAGAEAPARLRLESELLRLQQDFREAPSAVRLSLHVRLVDVAARRVLGDRELDAVEPARTDDAYGGVVAANAAAARLVAEVAALCAEWARAAGPAGAGAAP